MTQPRSLVALLALFGALAAPPAAGAAEIVPPAGRVRREHPRLMVTAGPSPNGISVAQLRATTMDADARALLALLTTPRQGRAAPLAFAYLLTGDTTLAERALEILRRWRMPDVDSPDDPFRIYFGCEDMALAYDWLSTYSGFTGELKAELRRKVMPLAEVGVKRGRDHPLHNYVWMWNCGPMLWALATLGEDPRSDALFETLRPRFNDDLFGAMAYLGGANSEPMGYWTLYCHGTGVNVLLAVQSAFDMPVAPIIAQEQGDWLNRQVANLALSTLPSLRYMHWGDMQTGPNGGVTMEVAGFIDALTWLLKSPTGAYLSRRLAEKRGLARFYGRTAIFYFLYTRRLGVEPATPPLAVLSGGAEGGQMLARSGWDDGATLVGFRCTDFFGRHNHWDQGSFVVYRNGALALDTGVYSRVAGPQQETACHNTLLFGEQGQRRVGYQSAPTLAAFRARLAVDCETGDLPFYRDTPEWAAAAGRFAQAYDPQVVASCIRQLLFIRPGTVVVVDQIAAPPGKTLPEVQWLLHLPGQPQVEAGQVLSSNGRSWIRCRTLMPGAPAPQASDGPRTPEGLTEGGGHRMIPTWRAAFAYPAQAGQTLVHVVEVGDGAPGEAAPAAVRATDYAVLVTVGTRACRFERSAPFAVAVSTR